jgi:hypothetical protein
MISLGALGREREGGWGRVVGNRCVAAKERTRWKI